MKELVLYHFPGACSGVTMTALEELGLDYDDVPVNIMKGEQKGADYLAINPAGQVPALKIGDRILTESTAIQLYLDATHPDAGLLPKSTDAFEHSKIVSELFWVSSTVHPAVRQMRAPQRYTDGDKTGIMAKGKEMATGIAQRLQAHLADRDWWFGADWSIVDIYLYWCFSMATSAGFVLDDYPAILAHRERVAAWPSYQRARAREQASH
ncbi:MAG: glutathione S-transferase family protein, partial [Myxococcota bacterium]